LLTKSIDYAGLFPPAGLDMAEAMRNYGRYLSEPAAWALGRFVVPASRLDEFEAVAARSSVPRDPRGQPWLLALLGGSDLAPDLERTAEFNHRHTGAFLADTIEVKATSVRGIEEIMHLIPRTLQAYIEVPVDRDPRELLATVRRLGGRAKVRTGGVTRDAFPSASDLMRFLGACVQAGLSFKATAGLHHAVRAEYRLTYAPDGPSGPMFGFLNLFLATAFLKAGMKETDAAGLLQERSSEALQFDEDGLTWRGHRLDVNALRDARRLAVMSFGSCSFTEPIEELEALHLLGSGARQG
jgi:hypothetical protein